ncbi:MAG: MBL fold metallo-hydrolase [Bryobacteraceae bacterium]
MVHEILTVGMIQCNCSILGDELTHDAIVVDPGENAEDILEVIGRHGLQVKTIVLTHGHFDHVGAVTRIKAATGAPVLMNEDDVETLSHADEQAAWVGMAPPDSFEIDGPLRDGDVLKLSNYELTVLHTPGHTPGSVCLWIPAEKMLIAGDTLFRDSVGRTDLPGGDFQQIVTSIRSKLLPLPDETVVFPGHGAPTSIGREKQSNYFLQGF